MSPREWINAILQRHGLERPDGRQLFQYRVTDKEFDDLGSLLKTSTLLGLENITRMLSWDAAFVMYAAEWWRRCYEGHWGWDGIFSSVGIDYRELTAADRNALIEMGLYRWRREVRIQNGFRRFLGTVATEGGLPLHQLTDSGGWLRSVLQPVLRKHVLRDISINVLVENYSESIPASYRSNETIQILADIAETVVSLRRKHELMNKESPLDWLDQNKPNWRELFPLPIDDTAGISLLSDLIDTASKTRADDIKINPFEVERFIVRTESDRPELIAQLEMPTFVYLSSLGIDPSETHVPTKVTLEVFQPNGETVWPWCRGLYTTYRGNQALKLSGKTLRLVGADATRELGLRVKSLGETVLELDLVNGGHLDTELPWLFKTQDNKWTLHGIASQSTEKAPAIAYIPSNYSLTVLDDNTELIQHGRILSGHVYKITGSIRCSEDDVRYKLSAGVEESIVQYQLSGNRFRHGTVPSEVFLGIPRLIEKNSITGVTSINRSNQLVAKPIGERSHWKPLSQDSVGFFEVRLLNKDHDVQLRKRIGILNERFSFKIKPDPRQVKQGSIQLFNAENLLVNAHGEDVSSSITSTNEYTEIHLVANETPPLRVTISLLPNDHNRELLVTLPFPSIGALLFDAEGRQIPFSTQLCLNNLAGYRIKVFLEQFIHGQKAELLFQLQDPELTNRELKDLYIRREMSLEDETSELSLYDWMQYIDSLMSISSSLSATVKVSMICRGRDVFSCCVYRYENELVPVYEQGTIEIDTEILSQIKLDVLEKTKVSAFNLLNPEQSSVNLDPIASNLAMVGKWRFSPGTVEPSPWLIFPDVDSKLQFRPMLWYVGLPRTIEPLNTSDIDTLPKAVSIADQEARYASIRAVLDAMSQDIQHKSWRYISSLWKKSSHLSMSTFDIWKVATSETGFLASLLVFGFDEIAEKLELDLPLIWELVGLEEWERSLNLYQDNITANLNDDKELVYELLSKKIEKIESLNVSMLSIGKILRLRILDEKSPDLVNIPNFIKILLPDACQELLRRQAENIWPTILSNQIDDKSKNLPKEYTQLIQIHHDHHRSILVLPLVMAWRLFFRTDTSWPASTVDLFKIQQLKEFDEEWFDIAFQYLSGWLSQQDNLEMV